MEYYGPSSRSRDPKLDAQHVELIRLTTNEADIAIRAVTHSMTSGVKTIQAGWYGEHNWTFSRHTAAVEQAMSQFAGIIASGHELVQKFTDYRQKPEDRRMLHMTSGNLFTLGSALFHFGNYVCKSAAEVISRDDLPDFVIKGVDQGRPLGREAYMANITETQDQSRALHEELKPIADSNGLVWADWEMADSMAARHRAAA